MKIWLVLSMLLLTAGCATTATPTPPAKAEVFNLHPLPVVEPCVSAVNLPRRPMTNLLPSQTREQRLNAMLLDLEDKEQYIITAELLLEKCSEKK